MNTDCFVVNSLCLRPHLLVHLKFVAFCLLFGICKQQVKQYNYCMYVDQSELLTSSWTEFYIISMEFSVSEAQMFLLVKRP